MAVQNDALDDLERQRLELEENLRKLRQSLYNWRLWEAEYDGLKDELETLEEDYTSAEILQVGIDFEGTVVDEKEVKALIGDGQGITRSRDQVVQQISRRLDYVKQNVASIEKRLATAEVTLDRLFSIERPGPNAATEEYAVTEIFEELDENGDVVSSKISNPADHAPDIMDVLKRAGVEMSKEPEKQVDSDDKVNLKEKSETPSQTQTQEILKPTIARPNKEQAKTTPSVKNTAAKTNAEGSDDSDFEYPASEIDESPEDARLRREMLEYSFHEVGKVVAELEMDEEGSDVSYDDDDYDDDYEDEDEDEYGRTTSAVLTDDYHQQMKELEEKLKAGGFLNLGPARNMPAGPAEEASRAGVIKVASVEKDADNEISDARDNKEEKKKPKKKVAFAEELDIAPEPKPSAPSKPERKIDVVKADVTPLSESIVERSTSKASIGTKDATAAVPAKKRASRFKAARNDGTPTPGDSSTAGIGGGSTGQQQSILKKSDQAPTASTLSLFPARPKEPKPFSQPIIAGGDIFSTAAVSSSVRGEPQPPEGKISAETLIERPPVVDGSNVLPPDPDEIDEGIHRKEIASEFYRRRNIKIQQSGGFMKDDEDEQHVQGELYELDENDQPKRKVSKFKAARVRP